MSDTPRTDDAERHFGEMPGLMRQMERELNAAQAKLAAVRPLAQQCAEWHLGDTDECGRIARELDLLLKEET